MNVSVLQENLKAALDVAEKFTDPRSTLPILGNVLLETGDAQLTISATNLTASIQIAIGAKVDIPFSVTLPAKTLSEVVDKFAQERIDMEFDLPTATLTLFCANAVSTIKGISAADYPLLTFEKENPLSLPVSEFVEMVTNVAPAAAKESNRPILRGILLRIYQDKIVTACADGYRLAVCEKESAAYDTGGHEVVDIETQAIEIVPNEYVEYVLPASILKDIAKILDGDTVNLYLGKNKAVISTRNISAAVLYLEGRFPQFDAIIPSRHETQVWAPREPLLRAFESAKIFAKDNLLTTSLKVEGSTITCTGRSPERGDIESAVEIKREGDGIVIGANVTYLIDALKTIKDEQVRLSFCGHQSPILVEPAEGNGFLTVIMPVALRE